MHTTGVRVCNADGCADVVTQCLAGPAVSEERASPALEQYKSLIRQQDARLTELTVQLDALLARDLALQVLSNCLQ
jgi:hypothetical protein